ncbi:hypothetical protein F2Q69_00026741, partial [Brassica cretica]
MAISGTYVADMPLKGSVEKHYKRWKSGNHIFSDAIGHHIQGVAIHDGDWDSHGSIRSRNITCDSRLGRTLPRSIDGKPEVFKEKRE